MTDGNGVNGAVIIRHALTNANRANGATLKLQSGSGVVSIGGNIAGLTHLTLDSGSEMTIAGSISGTGGSLTKLNTNTLNLNGLASYTGLTTVTAGEVVFTHNTVPSTSGFAGDGKVTVKPVTTFAAALSTNRYTYAPTLTGLTFGGTDNTAALNEIGRASCRERVSSPV